MVATSHHDPLASYGLVKIIHGANDGIFNVGGASVASVRASLAVAFNIPDEAIAFVNGELVRHDFRVWANDILEFIFQWGGKGGSDGDGKARDCYGLFREYGFYDGRE